MPVRSLFLPILFDPGYPTLAGGRVTTGKNERRDFRICDFLAIAGVLGQNSNEGRFQCGTGHAIEDVALEFRTIFLSESNVATVVERFFERFAQFLFVREFGNPTFNSFPLTAGSNFELIGIEFARARLNVRIHVLRDAHARVSSICALEDSICTSGLKACTGRTGSFRSAMASGSVYVPLNVAFMVCQRPP